jgi:hypothetical protein
MDDAEALAYNRGRMLGGDPYPVLKYQGMPATW